MKTKEEILNQQIEWLDDNFSDIEDNFPPGIAIERALGAAESTYMLTYCFYGGVTTKKEEVDINSWADSVRKRIYKLYYSYFLTEIESEGLVVIEDDFWLMEKQSVES